MPALGLITRRGLCPLVVTLAALASSLGCSKICTLVGCSDSATIVIRRADDTTPSLALELEIDGRRVLCAAPVLGTTGDRACDDASVSVGQRERRDCTETRTPAAASVSCTPNGRFEQVIQFVGTPQRVVVIATRDGALAGQRTFAPSYRALRPNGEDCEPVCRQWSETWVLP
jgi:hypothetical protein